MFAQASARLSVTLILLIAVGVLGSRTLSVAQTMGEPEHFTTTAVDMNTGWTGRIEIDVNRWSTSSEREVLTSALFKEGSEELLDKLRDMKSVGRIYTPGSIGYDLRFAEQTKLPEGGRRIVLATDRPMSFWEAVNRPRSADYPFTWVQMTIDPDGGGKGELAVRAKVFGDRPNRPIEVETFEIHPIRLQTITSRKGH
jgi:hypothetical protein